MKSYTVVGGGLAGLTAAIALANDGNRVTVLERSQHLGGRARTQVKAGYSLNLGPHALYRDGIALQTLSSWKIPFSGGVPPTGPNTYLVRENQLYPFVRDFGSLLHTRLFTFGEKLEAMRLLRLFSSGNTRGHRTMNEWISKEARSSRVRDLAAMLTRVTTYTARLEHLSAKAALQQIAMALKHDVLYLDGGWQKLIEGLERRAAELGVEIRCGQPVKTLQDLHADGIILAIGPADVEKLTGRSFPRRPPLRMATLDLGLHNLPRRAARLAFSIDRPLYFSMHSDSAKLAPQGGAMIHVAKYLSDGEPAPGAVRQELEEFATLVLPEWKRCAQLIRFLPNITVAPMMASVEGRPAVDFLRMECVAIAGDWVGEEGMLADTAVASALRAAQWVQERKVQVA